MRVREHGCCHRGGGAPASAFSPDDAPLHYAPDERIELLFLTLDLRVDLEAERVSGTVTHRVRGRAGAAKLTLDAVEIDILEVRGAAHATHARHLVLSWAEPFEDGEEREVTIGFRVEKPRAGVYFSMPSESRPDAATFAVTDHETERARYWLPTVDHPSARPRLRTTITARDELTVLANGRYLESQAVEPGWKKITYELDAPCPSYLTCFAVGRFVSYQGAKVRDVPVEAYAPDTFAAADVERTFGKTSDIAHVLESIVGAPLPYPCYRQFAATGIGGAMENITLVSWDDRFVLDEALAREEQDLVDIVNVHEMAHAWFGDHVTCRDHSHAWLKESFATYVESLYLERTRGEDALHADLLGNRDAYFAEHDDRYKRPIVTRRFESSWDLFDAHLYPGGALRLHALRCELGDEAFFAGVRLYLARHGGGTAETDDLRRALEQTSGRELARFFDQWLLSPGFPELDVKTSFDAIRGVLQVSIEQKQADPATGIPLFEFPFELGLGGPDGERRVHVHVRERKVVAEFPCEYAPAYVALDPRGRSLVRCAYEPGEAALLSALSRGSTVLVRVDAARRLLAGGRVTAAAHVGRALAAEKNAGARIAMVRALGRTATASATRELLTYLAHEHDPRVVPILLSALGERRDPAIVPAVQARIAEGLGPRALEAAHETLGRQRAWAPLDQLIEATAAPCFGGFAAAGALRGLGQSGRPEAMTTLIAALGGGGTPSRARPAAAGALATLATRLGDPHIEAAIDALEDALEAPDRKVRDAAANALIGMGRARALDSAERHARTMPTQDRVRMARRIRATASAPTAETLERLERKVDKLGDDLDKLRAERDKGDATPP